jgi:hypothetical protein
VPDVVARFNALIDNQLSFTAGQDTMIMMATDFSGENAPTWFRNIDKLIHYANGGDPTVPGAGKYNLLYSTPSIYTAAKVATTPLLLTAEASATGADGERTVSDTLAAVPTLPAMSTALTNYSTRPGERQGSVAVVALVD